MFQQKEIAEYQKIAAPVRLKERVSSSVKIARKRAVRQRAGLVTVAAGIVLFLLVGIQWDNTADKNNMIISVNDMAVSYRSVELEFSDSELKTAFANVERENVLQIQVPMEVKADKTVRMAVSDGTLQMMASENTLSEKATELEISEPEVVYWTVTVQSDTTPICTIVTDGQKYVYVIEYDEDKDGYIIRQKK